MTVHFNEGCSLMMKRLLLFCSSILVLTASCSHSPIESEEIVVKPLSGEFGLSYLRGLGKSAESGQIQQGADVHFDLGSIKGSSSFYFLLYNVGSRPITEVILSLPDSNFAVYPTAIDTLVPDNNVGMLPVVKISAYHGTAIDGAGWRSLMPIGQNETILDIKGKTKTSDGRDTTINLKAELDVEALILNVDLTVNGQTIDLTKPYSRTNDFPLYKFPGCQFALKNTGNVPAAVRVYYSTPVIFDTAAYDLDVNEEVTIPKLNSELVVTVDGSNTVCDPDRFTVNSGGLMCFHLDSIIYSDCPIDTINIEHFKSMIEGLVVEYEEVSRNRLFVVDNRFVMWAYRGHYGYSRRDEYYLFDKIPSVELASIIREKGGSNYITKSLNDRYLDMLETMRYSLLSPNSSGLENSEVVEIDLD